MKSLLYILTLSLFIFYSEGRIQGAVRYHCGADSVKVMQLIEATRESGNASMATLGDKIVAAAKSLVGIPLAGAVDNDSIGTLVVRLDSLSRRELVYMAIAAAKTSQLTAPSLRDFEKNLEDISRKKGVDEGFVSQYLYAADWVGDNVYRDNIKEMTEYVENGNYRTKTLDYVSRHPDQFPAMANPEVADKIKTMEFGFRSHRIPHLKKHAIGNKNVKELLQNGDIIIMNPNDSDSDVFDIGIVTIENNEPVLIHIPHGESLVSIDQFPLSRRFKIDGQYFYGFRWLRVKF